MTNPGNNARDTFIGDTRNVCIPQELWDALSIVAQVNRRSISAELRAAALAHVGRYGMTVGEGEMGKADPDVVAAVRQQGSG
jgi:hypothetical protein